MRTSAPERFALGAIEDVAGTFDNVLCFNVLTNSPHYALPLERLLHATRRSAAASREHGGRADGPLHARPVPRRGRASHSRLSQHVSDRRSDSVHRRARLLCHARIPIARTNDGMEMVVDIPHYWRILARGASMRIAGTFPAEGQAPVADMLAAMKPRVNASIDATTRGSFSCGVLGRDAKATVGRVSCVVDANLITAADVIAKYERLGMPGALAELDGDFAIALHDERTRTHVARARSVWHQAALLRSARWQASRSHRGRAALLALPDVSSRPNIALRRAIRRARTTARSTTFRTNRHTPTSRSCPRRRISRLRMASTREGVYWALREEPELTRRTRARRAAIASCCSTPSLVAGAWRSSLHSRLSGGMDSLIGDRVLGARAWAHASTRSRRSTKIRRTTRPTRSGRCSTRLSSSGIRS